MRNIAASTGISEGIRVLQPLQPSYAPKQTRGHGVEGKVPSLVISSQIFKQCFYDDLPSSASNKFLSTIAALFWFIYYSIKAQNSYLVRDND